MTGGRAARNARALTTQAHRKPEGDVTGRELERMDVIGVSMCLLLVRSHVLVFCSRALAYANEANSIAKRSGCPRP